MSFGCGGQPTAAGTHSQRGLTGHLRVHRRVGCRCDVPRPRVLVRRSPRFAAARPRAASRAGRRDWTERGAGHPADQPPRRDFHSGADSWTRGRPGDEDFEPSPRSTIGPFTGRVSERHRSAELESWLAELPVHILSPSARILGCGRNTHVRVNAPLASGECPVIVKSFGHVSFIRQMRTRRRGSKAKRSSARCRVSQQPWRRDTRSSRIPGALGTGSAKG